MGTCLLSGGKSHLRYQECVWVEPLDLQVLTLRMGCAHQVCPMHDIQQQNARPAHCARGTHSQPIHDLRNRSVCVLSTNLPGPKRPCLYRCGHLRAVNSHKFKIKCSKLGSQIPESGLISPSKCTLRDQSPGSGPFVQILLFQHDRIYLSVPASNSSGVPAHGISKGHPTKRSLRADTSLHTRARGQSMSAICILLYASIIVPT